MDRGEQGHLLREAPWGLWAIAVESDTPRHFDILTINHVPEDLNRKTELAL